MDGLEQWRRSMAFGGEGSPRKIVLCGHSVGGYLSVAYAERHPEHVARLILASPVGIPPVPAGRAERMQQAPWYFRMALSMWRDGWSPFAVVRNTPGLGKAAIRRYCQRRFKELSWTTGATGATGATGTTGTAGEDAKSLLADYYYANWCHGKISAGGYAHSTLLLPGAFARKPLCDRLPALYDALPVSFIYGTRDWMDWEAALDVATAVESDIGRPSNNTGKQRGGSAQSHNHNRTHTRKAHLNFDILRVEDGGHQLMVDSPLGFAQAVMMSGTEESRRLGRGAIVGAQHMYNEFHRGGVGGGGMVVPGGAARPGGAAGGEEEEEKSGSSSSSSSSSSANDGGRAAVHQKGERGERGGGERGGGGEGGGGGLRVGDVVYKRSQADEVAAEADEVAAAAAALADAEAARAGGGGDGHGSSSSSSSSSSPGGGGGGVTLPPVSVDLAEIVADNGDGTFKLCWIPRVPPQTKHAEHAAPAAPSAPAAPAAVQQVSSHYPGWNLVKHSDDAAAVAAAAKAAAAAAPAPGAPYESAAL